MLRPFLLLLLPLLVAACAPPCEVLCTRLAECNLADGGALDACVPRCEEALPTEDERAECARCADRLACVDLVACGTICPLDAGGASLPETPAPALPTGG